MLKAEIEHLVGTYVEWYRPGSADPFSGVVMDASDNLLTVQVDGNSSLIIHPSWIVGAQKASTKADTELVRSMIALAGDDPDRPGLLETPDRFIKAWKFWNSGYGEDPASILKVFEDGAESCDQMVILKNIPVWSRCEHHLAPFFGVAHVAYIPDKKIVGLSKLARLVNVYSRRLQVQERLTNQIADALQNNLNPKGVGVVLTCRHTCMESRGVGVAGVETTTSALREAILNEPSARAEFYSTINAK